MAGYMLIRMLFHLETLDWRALRRRLFASLTLLAYVVAAIGFPVLDAPAQSAHACGQQVCGCGTVEQCKEGGCCCSRKAPEAPPEEQEPADCCAKEKPAKSG